MIADPATKRLCVSRKSVPKQKGRIPLDELLAAHLASDDVRLAAHGLRRIFRGLDVDGRRETRPGRKTAESVAGKPVGARVSGRYDSDVVQTAPTRLIGYARVSRPTRRPHACSLTPLKPSCERIFEDKESGALSFYR